MKLFDVLNTANSNLLRNKGRSFLTILAIFIGSFTIIATSGIRTGVNSYIDQQLAAAGGEGYIEIMPQAVMDQMSSMIGGGGDGPTEYNKDSNGAEMQVISEDDMNKILAIDGMQSVRGYRSVSVEYIGSAKTDKKFLINVNTLPTDRLTLDLAEGKLVETNGKTPEISLLPGYATALGFASDADAVGQKVKIGVAAVATNEVSEVEAVVTGVLNKSVISMGQSWINDATETKLVDVMYAGLPDSYKDMVYMAQGEFDPDLDDEAVTKIKDELKELGFIGMTVSDQVGMMMSFFDAIIMVFTIFGGIALLAASIGIINTLFMAVQERTREIGLMKAMGLGKGKIFLTFSVEAIALGFWGSFLGVAVAYIARAILNPLALNTFLKDLPGFNLLEYDLKTLAFLILLVMTIAFAAGSLPARRASKKDPIEALRYE
jgi:ABC-type transport system, involved in lipoprotein release, permease component